MLNPRDQLRYRIDTPLPTHPAPGTAHTTALARRLPSMLWSVWSLPLSIPSCHQRQLRPALSIALLLVNSRLNLDEGADLIDSPIDGHAVSRVLQLLENHDHWPNIRAGLTRMADYLADHDVPIDYQRRRQLDYRMLLPDKVWAQICRDTATPAHGRSGPGSPDAFCSNGSADCPPKTHHLLSPTTPFGVRSRTSPDTSHQSWSRRSRSMRTSSWPTRASAANL